MDTSIGEAYSQFNVGKDKARWVGHEFRIKATSHRSTIQLTPTILTLVILAYALTRGSGKFKPARLQTFTGWQKLAGAVALIIALLIVLNPEFLALGLVGDTAFFDLLVFAITLQLQGYGTRVWRSVSAAFSGIVHWLWAPRPSFAMFLLILAPIGEVITWIQKIANRVWSDRGCLA